MDERTQERLIEAVRSFPCIWNNLCSQYRELRTKENAWKAVHTQMGLAEFTIDDLQKRWKSLRDRYCRESKKVKSKKSGDPGPPYVPAWPIFKFLTFLEDTIKHRSTSSNFPEPTGDVSPPVSPAVEQVASVIEQEENEPDEQSMSHSPPSISSEPPSRPSSSTS
jgi:hypothetical protein